MRNSSYRSFIVAFLLLVIPSLGTAQNDKLELSDFQELEAKVVAVADRCMASSVGLGSKERPENGSAVVVSEDGLLLTAYHVVEGLPDDNMIVSFVDGTTARAKKLGGVPKLDIAMAQIIDEGEYPFVEIGDMKDVQNGDWCISIAHAGGFQSDRTPPVRLGRVVNRINPGGFLQMTSTLIGGDSGGPTFDLDGKVIGIHSNIGGSLTQNQACPISDFTKKDHWQRMLDGEVWGKPGEENAKKKKKDKKDSKGEAKKDSDKEDSDKQDSDKQDSDKQDSDKQDSDKQDSDKQDSDKQDSDKQDSDKQDSDKQDSDKQDSDKQDSKSKDQSTDESDKQATKKIQTKTKILTTSRPPKSQRGINPNRKRKNLKRKNTKPLWMHSNHSRKSIDILSSDSGDADE